MNGEPDPGAGGASAAIFDFLALVIADRQRGELRALTEYQRLFPGFEAEIAVEYERVASSPTTPSIDAQPAPIGRYKVLHELGRGGQARVWLAFDEKLHRHVAIKIVTGSFGSVSHERRERLRREANAISRLDHPGICAVYEADLDCVTPYLAMRYVPGETLAARLVSTRKRLARDSSDDAEAAPSPALRPRRAEELSEFLRFFEKLARAVHAAHEAGLVHRDIKPSNVMVTPAGEPVILDFGLARDESSDEVTLTQSDAIVGTPVYMAPEQLGLAHGEPDRRTDVYSLGTTLYECLTLERPFVGRSVEAVREAIRAGALADPKQHNPSTPTDLRVVVATALDRDPQRRYANALDLAEDLRRIREYEPILARPPSAWTRVARWRQRHPTVAAALALLVLGLSVLVVIENKRARELRAMNANLMSAALRDRAADKGPTNPLLGLFLARAAYANEPSARSNRALLDALQRPTEEHLLMSEEGFSPQGFDCSTKGSLVATGGGRGWIDVWDIAVNERVVHLQVSETEVFFVDIAPDDQHVAYATKGGESGVVSLADNSVQVQFAEQGDSVLWIEFDPRGEQVATASLDGTVRVVSAHDGRELIRFCNGADPVSIVRWSSAGDRLITSAGNMAHAYFDKEGSPDVRVWDAQTGVLVHELRGHTLAIRSIECSRDGRRVLTAANDGTVRMWDAVTGEELWSTEAPGMEGSCARFSPSESLVAFAYDPGLHVLDASTGSVLHSILNSGERRVTDVDFNADETLLLAPSQDGCARLFRTSDAKCVTEYRSSPMLCFGRFCDEGRRIAIRDGAWGVHVWRCDEQALPITLTADRDATEPEAIVRADLDSHGAVAVTAFAGGCVRVWEVNDPGATSTLLSCGASVVCASFDRLGERLAIVREDGSCEIRSRSDSRWSHVASQRAPSGVLKCACFTPLGRLVCAGAADGRVWLFDAESAREPEPLGELGRDILSVRVSDDDRTLLAARADGTVSVWNLRTRGLVKTLRSSRTLPVSRLASVAMAFGRDGTQVAINFGESKHTILYRLADLELLDEWDAPVAGALQFAPSANELLEIDKWHATGRVKRIGKPEIRARLDLGSWMFVDCDATADGRLLATGWSGPSAFVFDIERGEVVLELSGHTRSVTCIRFSRDGKRLITGSKDGTAIVWPVDISEEAERRLPEITNQLLYYLHVTPEELGLAAELSVDSQ